MGYKFDHSRGFTVSNNAMIEDSNLSFKAKGLLLYILSRPDKWAFSAERLAMAAKDGKESVKSGLQELVNTGYLVRTQTFDEHGMFSGYDYHTNGGSLVCEISVDGKSADGKCVDVKHADIIKKDITKTDITNKEWIDKSIQKKVSVVCQNPEDSDVREASFPAGNNENFSLTGETRTDTEMPCETKKGSFPSRIYQDVVDRYNRTCTSLPRCTVISDKRKKLIKACWKEYGEKIYEAFEKAEASDFLSGRSGDWNGCGFDWLMNKNNMLKVLENNYGNCTRKKKNPVDDNMPYRFSNEEFHRQMEEIEKDPRYKGDGDITFLF